jgi:hypothetical protein
MPDPTDVAAAPIPASPELNELLRQADDLLATLLAREIQTVRAVEPRADTKAGNLLSLCSALLIAGLALLGSGKLAGLAATVGWSAAALLGTAVVLLTTALRPNLSGGGFGFVHWARLSSTEEVVAAVAEQAAAETGNSQQVRELTWLSRSLLGKFHRIRAAQTLLVAALAVAAVAAALSALGR